MKKRVFLTAMLIALMAFAFEVQAQMGTGRGQTGKGQMGMGRGQMNCGNCIQSINLSNDQQKNINSLRLEFMKETIPARNQIQLKQLEMTTLMSETTPESKKVMALQEEILKLRQQVSTKRLSCQLRARKLLNPDQIQNLPPRCGFGFAGGCGNGMGMGQGRCGMGRGFGRGGMNGSHRGFQGKGCCW